MKKQEYISKISNKLGISKKDVGLVIDSFLDELSDSLSKKDLVTITNVGTFRKEHVVAKNMFSPIDGSNLKNDYYRIHFSISSSLSKKIKEENK